MRWLRPTVSRGTPQEAIDEASRVLEAAAHEAPPSQRAEAIRQALLDEVDAGRRGAPSLLPLALAAGVLVLGLLVGIGGPAVGSWIADRLERAPASPEVPDTNPLVPSVTELPQNEDPAAPTRGERPSDAAIPSPSVVPAGGVPEPTPVPASTAAPVGPPTPTPPDADPPSPTWPPGGPPSPMPTPPPNGPPPGTPGG